jgi:protein-tyrosine phosphatase
MIDLHCHILPGIDDGPTDLSVSLAMARAAVKDGITFIACTPHIYPGLYENNRLGIEGAVEDFRRQLAANDVPLQLGTGADVHLAPDLVGGIRTGRVPTICGTRYLLLEPPHHVAPPRFNESVFTLMAAGYVPVITHPERLSWIETHYSVFTDLVKQGAWMQLTAGSLTGRFGRRPQYWADRMLDEGMVHILATDSHHIDKRPPLLAEGRDAAAKRLGAEEATHLVLTRPQGILDDAPPAQLPALPSRPAAAESKPGLWQRLFGTAS